MATVRMTLAAAAGLLVCGMVCGTAFAGGPAGPAITVPDQSEVSGAVKPKAAESSPVSTPVSTPVSKKTAKTVMTPKAGAKTAKRSPVSGRMQVEEPKAAAPANPARESKAWQKSHARGLTDAQKKAFRERKENMEGMIAVIKEKRKALRDAKPEERAALARELHSLILEKDPAAHSSASAASAATARVGTSAPDKTVPETKSAGQASQRDDAKKAEAEEERRKRNEAHREQLRKKEEIRKQQHELHKSGLENGQAPISGLSQGAEED